MSQSTVDGHPREVWWGSGGETVVESYTISDMAHGTPLGIAETDKRYGTQGAFMIEAGISSSYHIAKFFGLTGWIRERKPAPPQMSVADSPSAKLIPMVSPIPSPLPIQMPNLGKSLWSAATVEATPPEPKREAHGPQKPQRVVDVNAVITRALTAAGLMK
jgi:hypothetical protein